MTQPKTILVADDSPTIVEIMKFMLGSMGYEVEVATDGIEAIERTYAVHPDLILLDIEMPKMNGYQVCRLIKADRLTSHIPVLILTSRDQASDRFWGLATGADEYVVKDLEDETLFDRIQRLLEEGDEASRPEPPAASERGSEATAALAEREVSEMGVLAQVNALLDSRLFQSTIVNELGSLAVKMYDFDETATAVLDLLAKVVDLDLVILIVRDQPRSYLHAVVGQALGPQAVEQALARVTAQAEEHGMSLDPAQIEAATEAGNGPARALNTFEILPLRSRNRISGLLALGSRRENAISDDLMETLHLFTHESAIVLDNSLLYRQLGRANSELQRTIDELRASQAREAALRQEVRALKIEIDESKRQKQVAEITETDYFQQLREKARRLRDKE
ncbi:MAG: response regulator [Anaerolineae bacterium]|jgi:twitching motility two-component system response regulator PilH